MVIGASRRWAPAAGPREPGDADSGEHREDQDEQLDATEAHERRMIAL
jgi:hypothetical protein